MAEENLILQNYGVTLRRLTHDKIEMLRCWRNDPKIQQYMFYREYITPEMQKAWFARINNEHNYYFIIEYDGKEIGCVDIKDIDYDKKVAEPGIFIYDDYYLNSEIAIKATIISHDFAFYKLHLSQMLGHLWGNNKRAVRFNKLFGGRPMAGEENKDFQLWCITKEKYEKSIAPLRALFEKQN